MLTIQNSILEKLKETESTFSVKIPLAVESGSRGWGFPSPDSDYDCRFLYAHSPQDYLSIFEPRDVIEYSAGEIFDINGWDIKKAILHLHHGAAGIRAGAGDRQVARRHQARDRAPGADQTGCGAE